MSEYQYNPNVEQWKAIPGFPGYEVSDHGRVRSFWKAKGNGHGDSSAWALSSKPQRILQPQESTVGGYLALDLGRKARGKRVHGLVLLAFVGPCPPNQEGRHLDDDPKNNHLPNLCWGTRAQNVADRRINNGFKSYNPFPIGTKHPNSKLNEEKIIRIRELSNLGHSQRNLAKQFLVARSLIFAVIHRKIWTHI